MALSITGTVTQISQNVAQPVMNPPGSTAPATSADPGAVVVVTVNGGAVLNGMNQTLSFQKSTKDANTYQLGQAVTFTGSI